jgi:molybdopterin molybdotransferase
LITVDQALRIVLDVAVPLPAERRRLADVSGCILAEDVRADRDHPPADRSAMDGYAVQSADVREVPRRLRCVAEIAAGSPARPRVRPGTCALIMTGANVPPGADAVVMQEFTRENHGLVTVHKPVKPGENIRRRGEEARKGDVLAARGTLVRPLIAGLAAGVGKAEVKVYSRPRVAILVTGREVLPASRRVAVHQLRDSNGPALSAALSLEGFGKPTVRIVPDDLDATVRAIRGAAADADVVIITGGVSVGAYDLVPKALETCGASIRFHGVKMKPGRPQLYATLHRYGRRAKPRRMVHVFGLPGNPMGVMTGCHELVLPALRRLAGYPQARCRRSLRLPLAWPVSHKGGRAWFAPARLVRTDAGLLAEVIPTHGSADIASAAAADGVVVIPAESKEPAAGDLVDFRPWWGAFR